MKENLELVVNIVGDEQLTHTQIVKLVQENQIISTNSVQRWLSVATRKGLLGRVKGKNTTGIEYVYFTVGEGEGAELVVNDSVQFTIDGRCPSCGHEKPIKFYGTSSCLERLYSTMTWSCLGCGDYVRLSDCMIWRELLRYWTDWRDSRNPDMDMRLPSVSVCSL